MYNSDSGDAENSSLMGCDSPPLGKWIATFRSVVVSLCLSGCCIGCWTLGNVNTQGLSETSGNRHPAKQCHIPEDMVSFITTLVPSSYHMYCEVQH
jgi:hypothetical protein